MAATPISLLDRLKSRSDRAAWDQFVQLYTPLLYSWMRKTGLQEADAADLVQDALTVLVVQMPNFAHRRDGSFHAWLRTVVMNARRDQLKRKQPLALGTDGHGEPFVPDPLEHFIETEYRGHLALQALRIMQSDFTPQTWQAIWAWLVEGRPTEEVTQQFGLTLGGLYAAKCRVVNRLRAELKGLVDDL